MYSAKILNFFVGIVKRNTNLYIYINHLILTPMKNQVSTSAPPPPSFLVSFFFFFFFPQLFFANCKFFFVFFILFVKKNPTLQICIVDEKNLGFFAPRLVVQFFFFFVFLFFYEQKSDFTNLYSRGKKLGDKKMWVFLHHVAWCSFYFFCVFYFIYEEKSDFTDLYSR